MKDDPTFSIKIQAAFMARPDCQIARCDAWKPAQWPGRKWWFVISDFGNGYHVMRLFAGSKDRDYWVRRVRRHNAGRIQSHGTIRWKVRA